MNARAHDEFEARDSETSGSQTVRVSRAIAPLNADMRISSEQVSQVLRGHDLVVQETHDDWMNVRGADGYSGWIHSGYTAAASSVLHNELVTAVSLGCRVRYDGVAMRLPFGAHLVSSDELIDGSVAWIADVADLFPGTADAIVESARRFFEGTPYEWGGVTPWGADCSGFIQSVFKLHGIQLPRDAKDQAALGRPGAKDVAECGPGELAFFSEREDGRITHVGLAAGNAELLHVSLGRGGFSIENFSAASRQDAYAGSLRRRFRFAKIPLG